VFKECSDDIDPRCFPVINCMSSWHTLFDTFFEIPSSFLRRNEKLTKNDEKKACNIFDVSVLTFGHVRFSHFLRLENVVQAPQTHNTGRL